MQIITKNKLAVSETNGSKLMKRRRDIGDREIIRPLLENMMVTSYTYLHKYNVLQNLKKKILTLTFAPF